MQSADEPVKYLSFGLRALLCISFRRILFNTIFSLYSISALNVEKLFLLILTYS
jgi:hypothetical protein